MEFLPTVSEEATSGELEVWNHLKEAMRGEEGFAFLRYPIFVNAGARRYEPDILLLHRDLGFVVIEVKGCQAHQVEALEGQQWRMADWYEPYCAPFDQAQRQMWAMRDHFWRVPELVNRLQGAALVALPFVAEAEWQAKGFSELPCNPGILHQDHLTPARLRRRLKELVPGRAPLDDAQWEAACQVLGLRAMLERVAVVGTPPTAPSGSHVDGELLARIRESEARIASLDTEQLRIGFEIPPGPQRIRGIAGSGKTLLLAVKAARMHLANPDWDICFTFNTKSLYQVIRHHIERFCREYGGCEPNWDKLRVMHGWGGAGLPGFYSTMARAARHPARTVAWARERKPQSSPAEKLAMICQDLLANAEVPERFDAILIDEGQDFLPEFYRLAYQALRAPKRLVWAYDEAQSLDHLKIPNAETLFGRDEAGKLRIDLTGQYVGGILKSRIMRKCYRTPARILMPAHAFGMGLLRPRGPVQLITTKAGWQDIGYEVLEGAFDEPGKPVVITRPAAHCPHLLDQELSGKLLRPVRYANRAEELAGTAAMMADLAAQGVLPDDMLIVFLGSPLEKRQLETDMHALARQLQAQGLATQVADDQHAEVFRRPGAVTLSGIHRAKGNEAAMVFVIGLDRLAGREADITHRNQLFVGLTRARGICHVSGVVPQAERLFAELEQVLAQRQTIRFTAPDVQKVSRRDDAPEPAEQIRVVPFVTHLPLYSDVRVAAGPIPTGSELDPERLEWVDARELGTLTPDLFVVAVQGRSMEPKLQDGDRVVFQRIEEGLPQGKIVLASVQDAFTGGEVSMVVKRFDVKSDASGMNYHLTSLNPEFPPIPLRGLDREVRIVGIFKRVLRREESV